jgi:hypothetical protein
MFHEHAVRAVYGDQRASMALAAVCCDPDTIPKPDGLAGPQCGPSSNQNRTQPGRCAVLSGTRSSGVHRYASRRFFTAVT